MGINVTAGLKIGRRMKKFGSENKKVMNLAIKDVANDLLRVGMERAPYKTGTLEHSGTVKFSGNSSMYKATVSFCAVGKNGENYAKRMNDETYNLGKKSIEKSSKGARSAFSSKSFKVGTGYLTETAEACQEGYKKHLKVKVLNSLK